MDTRMWWTRRMWTTTKQKKNIQHIVTICWKRKMVIPKKNLEYFFDKRSNCCSAWILDENIYWIFLRKKKTTKVIVWEKYYFDLLNFYVRFWSKFQIEILLKPKIFPKNANPSQKAQVSTTTRKKWNYKIIHIPSSHFVNQMYFWFSSIVRRAF